jgi:release factor H-coupled RctB family protein
VLDNLAMGNFLSSAGLAAVSSFYSPSTWIDGRAVKQVEDLRQLESVTAVAAFPDLHPGRFGPVGIAVDSAEAIHPGLIGNDIGCGVALAVSDLAAHRLNLDRAATRLAVLDEVDLHTTLFHRPLGSIGGGNHFCELTLLDEVFDPLRAEAAGLRRGAVNILVHTGSRSLGTEVFEAALGDHGTRPLRDAAASGYLAAHDRAMAFARANRAHVIARAADALRCDAEIISDVPHNFVSLEDGQYRHRKGASTARQGLCVVLGSRGTLSYLVEPLGGPATALGTLAHGAGRKLDRASARARFGGKGVVAAQSRNPFGGRVVCTDKALAAEEAAGAYKSIDQVIADLTGFGLVRLVASLKPLLTFKTAGGAS